MRSSSGYHSIRGNVLNSMESELFEAYGIVDRVQIITARPTGRSRGFDFVEMPNATEAPAAIDALTGTAFGGRTLPVNEAHPREGEERPRRPPW